MKVLMQIDFPNSFVFKSNVLNKTYDFLYNKNMYKIYTPVYNGNNVLEFPKNFIRIKYSNDLVGYCYETTNDKCESCIIKKIFLEFEVNNKDEAKERIELICLVGKEIIEKVIKKIYILSNVIKINGAVEKQSPVEKVFSYANEEYHRMKFNSGSTITISILDERKTISDKIIKKALADINSEISESYIFYVNGVKQYEDRNYRHCILDCATGVEISITNELIKELKNKQFLKIDEFLKDYQGIDKKVKLLKHLSNYNLSGVNFKKVSIPRNKAIHVGASIDEKTAKGCIIDAKRIIDYFESIK